jgi:hypothetical protein
MRLFVLSHLYQPWKAKPDASLLVCLANAASVDGGKLNIAKIT